MTHDRPMKDSEGDFDVWKPARGVCRFCHFHTMQVRTWDSHDGAYTDHQFRCTNCGKTYWVDGDDG